MSLYLDDMAPIASNRTERVSEAPGCRRTVLLPLRMASTPVKCNAPRLNRLSDGKIQSFDLEEGGNAGETVDDMQRGTI